MAFDRLSLIAQYDDMCRQVNRLIQDSASEEESCIAMLESLQKRWNNREQDHERQKESLKSEISALQKEIKKLNRQLAESRSALVREADEKKSVAREKKALLDQIRQVRMLVEKESYGDTDAHRKRVIKCLDIERLSPIQSDDSDDCVSGLDYDRTEEDILDADDRSPRRRNNAFDDALENLQPNEQPTLLYRYLDRDKNSDDLPNHNGHNIHQGNHRDEPRRSSRLSANRRSAQSSSNPPTSATSSSNQHDKLADKFDLNLDTDTNSVATDDNDIEFVRQQLKKYEADKREKLAASNSTPNFKDQKKGATLSARSATNLAKSISSVATPVSNALKPHTFVPKKNFKAGTLCGACGSKVTWYGACDKCKICGVVSHPDCSSKCPLPCVEITAPDTRSRLRKILISDYVNKNAVPKVPALIVHCCNEIERPDNIVLPALYRSVAHSKDIEDLLQKILKSKSGMPNLSKVDVNVLTGVVKRFLMSLDESLITTTLWKHFAEAIGLDSIVEATTHMKYYIEYDLPTANRDTLSQMMQHLHAIAKHSDKNMMTTKNLAKTMAPTIIGNSRKDPGAPLIHNETKIQTQIMEILFEIEEEFWAQYAPRVSPTTAQSSSLGSRLLSETPSGNRRTRGSRIGSTLPTPKLKPLFS